MRSVKVTTIVLSLIAPASFARANGDAGHHNAGAHHLKERLFARGEFRLLQRWNGYGHGWVLPFLISPGPRQRPELDSLGDAQSSLTHCCRIFRFLHTSFARRPLRSRDPLEFEKYS